MSDNLVKRLRDLGDHASFEPHMHHTAADRIEELEAKLTKVVEALRGWIEFANEEGMPVALSDLEAAEMTGGKDE